MLKIKNDDADLRILLSHLSRYTAGIDEENPSEVDRMALALEDAVYEDLERRGALTVE